MLESSARRPAAIAATIAVLALATVGCGAQKKASPDVAPTPIGSLNTAAMQVPRIEFCKLVPGSAVTEALGGKSETDAAYGNGDEEGLAGAGKDVVHEIGCSWTGKDGAIARAWVFARPVSADFARTVIASGRRTRGCRTVAGAAYGQPATTQLCRLPDGSLRVRHAGLFTQTWLTCELAANGVEESELRGRTDRWCVEVVNALNTAR